MGSSKQDLSGPRTVGARGYAFASPTGSNNATIPATTAGAIVKAAFDLDGAVTETNKKLIEYDPDLLATTSTLGVVVIDVEEADHTAAEGDVDLDNLGAFVFTASDAQALADALTGTATQIRRLTRLASATDAATVLKAVRYVFVAAIGNVTAGTTTVSTALPLIVCISQSRIRLMLLVPLVLLLAIFSILKELATSQRSTSRSTVPLSPLRPKSSRLSGLQS